MRQLVLNKSNKVTEILEDYKVLETKRVTKIVKGGKNLSFRVVVIVGDKENNVGLGVGKATILKDAIEKAIVNAHKSLITIPLTTSDSIPYMIQSKYKTAKINLYPAKEGTGIITSKAIRILLEFGGIKNIFGKQLGCKNILNNMKAVIIGLSELNRVISISNIRTK
jgi:small subunit ribosomal protein S5